MAVPRTRKPAACALAISCSVVCGTGCASESWSIESEPVESSLTLLEGDTEIERVLVAETSHAGRINASVNLPGAASVQSNDGSDGPAALVVAELVLDDAHSHVTLPGSGGHLSVLCPGERCAGDEARLTVRLLSNAEIDSSGLFVEWEARAETFGEGAKAPADAEASLRVER